MNNLLSGLTAEKFIFGCLALYALLFSLSVPGANAAVDAALLTALYRAFRDRRLPPLDWRMPAVAAVFLAAAAAASVAALQPADAWHPLWRLFYALLPLPLALAYVRDERQRVWLFRLGCLSLLACSLVVFWQAAQGYPRAWGPTGTWLIAAVDLELAIPLLWVVVLEARPAGRLGRWALPVLLAAACLALVLVNSRAAWVAVAAALLLYFALRLRRLSRRQLLAFAVLLCLCLGAFAVRSDLQSRFRSISDLASHNNAQRLLMWQSAWRMFLDHPVLGVGPGNYARQYQTKYISPLATEPEQSHAHSNYLEVLAETGVPGLAAFLAMFAVLLRHYAGRYRRGDTVALGMLLAVASFMVHGLMDWNYGMFASTAQFFWFFVGSTWQSR